MKNFFTTLTCIFVFSSYIFSQPGSNCSNPYNINSLPFIQAGMTTAGFGNNYNASHACNSTYMSGADFVFQYIPTSNINISVKLTETGNFTGVFIIQGCPDNPTAICIEKKEETGGNPFIPIAALTSGETYYIIVSTYNVAGMFPNTPFKIEVSEVHAYDVRPIMLSQPRTRCDMSSTEQVLGLFKNIGYEAVTNFQVGYIVNDQPAIIETVTGLVQPQGEVYQTFQTTVDMAAVGEYRFKLFSMHNDDMNTDNDTLFFNVYTTDYINTYPYEEDFEDNLSDWVAIWSNQLNPGSSWEHGIPNGTIINSAASGNKCYATNLSGNTLPAEFSFIQGPCFDFSNLSLPILELDIWYETGVADLIYIDYSTNNATNWNRLGGYETGSNWYNVPGQYGQTGWNGSSGGWITARHSLAEIQGESNVLFRIVFMGINQILNEGVAIDNIRISESPENDLALISVLNPSSKCQLTNNETVSVKVANFGLNSQTNFEISYSLNNGANWTTETYSQVLAFGDTINYTFNQSANLSAIGEYNFIAKVNIPNDQLNINDSIKFLLMNYPLINNFPYENDFEQNNGYWLSEGLNASWEYGTPSDAIINSAASGTKAWATNLSGNLNDPESSTLTGPCVDISSLLNPHVKINIWHEFTNPNYCQLQFSDNDGLSWNTLGSANSPNWYNTGYSWTLSSGNWINVSHSLNGLNNNLRFRFNLVAPLPSSGFAFDDFTICDGPLAQFSQVYSTLNRNTYKICVENTSINYTTLEWITQDGQTSSSTDNIICFEGYNNQVDPVTITLIAHNSCATDTLSIDLVPASINTNSLNEIMIFPNPFSDIINIITAENNTVKCYKIIDLLGRTIHKSEGINNDKISINTSRLNKGSYIIIFETNKGLVHKNITKL